MEFVHVCKLIEILKKEAIPEKTPQKLSLNDHTTETWRTHISRLVLQGNPVYDRAAIIGLIHLLNTPAEDLCKSLVDDVVAEYDFSEYVTKRLSEIGESLAGKHLRERKLLEYVNSTSSR